ncbi:MAG: DUF362 domain-containing protein [Candidatus Hydrogenedentes bacterium]|nr:DUF362 domain-containing protein [Candidatus Hydrogenedentota bacterium]
MLGPIRLATAQEAAAPLQMCIARWKDAPLPETGIKSVATKLTEQAINALGGMKRFVGNGDVVWVKPNMAWDRTPEQAANTNPDVVATLVRLSLDAGAKTVKVGDRTCNEAKQSYPKSGIEAAVKAVDGEVVYLDDSRFKKVALNGVILKEWELYPEIIEADLVINVPVVKHHNISNATLCMKNYMGVISGNRGQWHQDLPNCLCDVTAFMKPRLCVLDAVRILTAHGPTGGNLEDVKRLDTIAAGTDIVALDSFGAELLGHPVGSLATVVAGEKAGLGIMDYHKIAQEIGVS